MLDGLLNMEGVTVCCLSPVNFTVSLQRSCGRMSWGVVNHVQQGEGGEQGDPLMPMFVGPRTAFCSGRDFGAITGVRAPIRIP